MNRVFTYGILQNYHEKYEGVSLISTEVRPKQKYDMRAYSAPLITPNDQGHHVNGTLLEADKDALKLFDRCEGISDHEGGRGGFYNRVVREMNDGSEAFVYEVPQNRTGTKPNVHPGEDGRLQWKR